MEIPHLTALSLGGGVQSTALALMSDAGLIAGGDKPEVAFFADTGWEPSYVLETVAAVKERVSFPVETVSNGRNLAQDVFDGVAANGNRFIPIPVFTAAGGMTPRQCTNQYKVTPLRNAAKRWLGYQEGERIKPGVRIEQWLGISTDEIARAKDSRVGYITIRYPLVESGLSRTDCAKWLAANHPDIPVGKSACVGCPYRNQESWRRIALDHPEDFARAAAIDAQMRTPGHNDKASAVYLHRARRPLEEAVAMSVNTPGLFEDMEDEVCDAGHCFL